MESDALCRLGIPHPTTDYYNMLRYAGGWRLERIIGHSLIYTTKYVRNYKSWNDNPTRENE
ncbi:hypothetical protein BN903_53 [Halorubrum sp. AJ67]|nr:hypothetical protein BN903_53 [Halorubrum sp. AJ67]